MNFSPFRVINVKVLVFILILFIASIFGYTRIYELRLGPKIKISSPQEGQIMEGPLVVISGQVERIAHLELNNRKIYADQDNNFSETLLLSPGYNILKIEAIDAFDRRVEKKITVFYNQKDKEVNPLPTEEDLEKIKESLNLEEELED